MAPRLDDNLITEENPFILIPSEKGDTQRKGSEDGTIKDEKEQILDTIGSKYYEPSS